MKTKYTKNIAEKEFVALLTRRISTVKFELLCGLVLFQSLLYLQCNVRTEKLEVLRFEIKISFKFSIAKSVYIIFNSTNLQIISRDLPVM